MLLLRDRAVRRQPADTVIIIRGTSAIITATNILPAATGGAESVLFRTK